LRLPGGANQFPGREFHPLESSAFHGALLRQLPLLSCDHCVVAKVSHEIEWHPTWSGWNVNPNSIAARVDYPRRMRSRNDRTANRQINSFVQSENVAVTAVPKISVDVKTTHQLIGENSYSPQSVATNTSDFLITITGVELVAEGTTFQNKPRVANYYPLNVPAHDTAALDVNFRFSDGVSKVFRNPSELRIDYSSQQGPGVARITLAGGPLNAK
jgi:hypothetical protein